MDSSARVEKLRAELQQRTGCAERDIHIVCSPLRISPLGAHVDHQGGLVTGMTLDRSILLAFVPRFDGRVRVESLNFAGTVDFGIDNVPPPIPRDWGNYVRGAVLALQKRYSLSVGMDALVEGDMPIGGLSSSAAVGIAYLLALEAVNELEVTAEDNIGLDGYIENAYLGLKNGILDQSIILMSDRDHITFLDCELFEFRKFSTCAENGHFEVLVAHSGVTTSLAGTDYNRRVTECQQAAVLLLELAGEPLPERPRLRLVSEDMYAQLGKYLPSPLDRRARHFFTENERVRAGIEAWRAGDLQRVGQLMNESGASSVYNYESGCPHLISLYNILRECPGVYGARFSGGGFRGSCIGLVDPAYRDQIVAYIDARYPVLHPEVADLYSVHFCRLDGPARLLNGAS